MGPLLAENDTVKIFISTDFEGVSGISDWSQITTTSPEWHNACELLLAETNAAIEGALAGGADSFVVNDSHSTMRNLDPARLAGKASYISGKYKPMYMMEGLDSSFDATFFIGYHGSAGMSSILSHTYNPRAISQVKINGRVMGEAGVNALVAQAFGVPIALVTGDDLTARESRAIMLGVRTIEVKRSVSRFAAHNIHPLQAREMIRSAAQEAVMAIGSLNASPIRVPAILEVSFLFEDMANMARWIDGVQRVGPRTVSLESSDTLSLFRRFVAIIYLTRNLVD